MNSILLIEDNQEILENTAEILELAGYTVFKSNNGKSGVEAAIEHHPDLIISDIMMPKLDGFGVLHLIQKHIELADTPFIFLTARADRENFRKGMEMGADDYITKPFSETELLNAVESRLQKASRIKEHILRTVNAAQHSDYHYALTELFKDNRVNHYKKKQIIFSERNYPQYLFYVQTGKVKAFKTNDDGKELTVGLYAEGDFIGYTALLEDSAYRVTAQALEDSVLSLISKKDFFDMVNSNSALAMKFIGILAKNNNQKAEQMVQLAYNSLRKRVANALIILRKKFTEGQKEHFSIRITREELANISGTTTESLIRTLSDFRSEKLIGIQGGMIEILDEKRLENMLN